MASEKQALRARLKALRHGPADGLCEAVLSLPQWRAARCVMGFYPIPGEPDIRPLLRAALASGKTLLLPVTDAENRLHPCRVASLDALRPGRYGIPEPDLSDETAQPPDLILLPALAYDLRCARLGRGAGCYDRYLPGTAGLRVGVCFDDCLLPSLPCEAHDVRADLVVTEKRIVQRTEDAVNG